MSPQPQPDQVPDGAPEPLPLIDPRLVPPEKQDEFLKAAVAKRKADVDKPSGEKVKVLVEGVTAGGAEPEADPVFKNFAAEPTAEERQAFAIGAESEGKERKAVAVGPEAGKSPPNTRS